MVDDCESGKRKSGDGVDTASKRPKMNQEMQTNIDLLQESMRHYRDLCKEAEERAILCPDLWHELVADLIGGDDLLQQRGLLCCVSKLVPLTPIFLRNEVIDRESLRKANWQNPMTREKLDPMPNANQIHIFCYKLATEALLRNNFTECKSTMDRYMHDIRNRLGRLSDDVANGGMSPNPPNLRTMSIVFETEETSDEEDDDEEDDDDAYLYCPHPRGT